uniref:Uncharacterized protein n=1 Tax=Glycine max TaxID=3847 RepID=K7K793_SOYBN
MNMMQMGTEDNAGNLANGSQDALPCTAGFMGNPMMNMGSEDYAGSQVALPYPGFMKNSAMNMDLEAGNQLIPQPNMMQPPFMPSDQLPYNFQPN